jgi:hypothetical protein
MSKPEDKKFFEENKPKEYKLLNKVNEYDHEVVEELAEAQNEIRLLQQRQNTLEQLIAEHSKLNKFIWGTAEGVLIPFHKLETDHLVNILKHIAERGNLISKELRAEALSRDLVIPMQSVDIFNDYNPLMQLGRGGLLI